MVGPTPAQMVVVMHLRLWFWPKKNYLNNSMHSLASLANRKLPTGVICGVHLLQNTRISIPVDAGLRTSEFCSHQLGSVDGRTDHGSDKFGGRQA